MGQGKPRGVRTNKGNVTPSPLKFAANNDFEIFGMTFDPAFSAACEDATEAGWRLQALLKVRRFFSTPEIFVMYKAQILLYIESKL